jgi:phosphoglycolate phosphatase-like HAD superfamily hydrolase
MIGDQPSDVAAGEAAGVRAVQFTGGDLASFIRSHVEPLRKAD